jgi:hypothetical protein
MCEKNKLNNQSIWLDQVVMLSQFLWILNFFLIQISSPLSGELIQIGTRLGISLQHRVNGNDKPPAQLDETLLDLIYTSNTILEYT